FVSIITVRPPAAWWVSPNVFWYGVAASGVGSHTRVVGLACSTSTRVVISKVRQRSAGSVCASDARLNAPRSVGDAERLASANPVALIPAWKMNCRRFICPLFLLVATSGAARHLDFAPAFLGFEPL